VGDLRNAILLPSDAELQQSACLFVNPFTCFGLLRNAQSYGAKAIINTAANSALGTMIFKLFSKEKLGVLNLVRSQKNVEQLRSIG
jgi:NADPH:quinone reductase-like Zn-dependent oxidoreductase